MSTKPTRRDEGLALPLVIVVIAVVGAVVLAIASFSATSLRFGQVAEDRSDRLAAADAGMRYAIDQIKLRNGCVFDDTVHVLPGITSEFNGATASVTCQLVTDGLDDGQLFAVAVTGEGVPGTDYLIRSQSGTGSPTPKTLGGPVYLNRITDAAMDMTAPLIIEGGMLYYHDPAVPCVSEDQSTAIANAEGQLSFDPALIYGPQCLNKTWQEKFPSPWTPDLSALPLREGDQPIPNPNGSYEDLPGCRVFHPGRYTVPPDVDNQDSYFMSGDYLFDFPPGNDTFFIKQSLVTMGLYDASLGLATANERANPDCEPYQVADPVPDGHGATIFLAKHSHIEVGTQGSLEIHARKQPNFYVSVQALCNPSASFCRSVTDPGRPAGAFGGDGNLGPGMASSLTTAGSSDRALYTNSGNNKEFVSHGYFYAPLAKTEFGNATNSAEQKMLGGLIAGQVHLQSSASATNFEIAVPTSPITGKVEITSTAVKNGTTQIRAVIQFRYEEIDPDDRVKVNSWRVCDDTC